MPTSQSSKRIALASTPKPEVDWAIEYKKARSAYIWARKQAREKGDRVTVARAEEHYKKMELAYRVDQLNKKSSQGK